MKKKNIKLFISWNVNGIRAMEKKGFVDTMLGFDADIVALQEIKANKEQLSDSLINIPGYYSYWYSAVQKGYSGVAAYTREKPLNVIYGLGRKEYDDEGRALTLEFQDFYFITCYFPNAQEELKRINYKIDFNNELLKFADKLKNKKSVVISGDFNVAHKPIDLTNPEANEYNPGYSILERNWMDSFIACGYTDTFRIFNKEPGNYTWWSYRSNARAKNIGWRIDYFCVDNKSVDRIIKSGILKDIAGSDHCPVSLEFRAD